MMTQLADINKTVLSIDSTVLSNFPDINTKGIWKITLNYSVHDGLGRICYEDETSFIEGLKKEWKTNCDSNIEEANQHHHWDVINITFDNIDYSSILSASLKKIISSCESQELSDYDFRQLNIFYYTLKEKYNFLCETIIDMTLKEGLYKLYDFYEQ